MRLIGALLVAAATLPVLVGSDLDMLSRNRITSREQAHQKAMVFVEELRRHDPNYYPAQHGLRTFHCRPRVSLTDEIFAMAKQADQKRIQSEDWAMDYYWEAPGRSFLSTPPWRRELGIELAADMAVYGRLVEGIMEGLVKLSPYRYELLFLEYDQRPGAPQPHHLHGIPRDSNDRNACVDFFFDSEYRLQSFTGNYRLYKFTRSGFSYEPTPAGIVFTGFTHRPAGSGRAVLVQIRYAEVGGFRLARSILLDLPEALDTESRKLLPIRIELGDVHLNQAVPETIRVQMQNTTW